jgi:hypothetical protein
MEPFGVTVFCDDIREELYGKISLIGVYNAAFASYAKFPISLSKLGFYITACFPSDGPHISDVHLHIYLPQDQKDKPSYSTELDWRTTAADQVAPDPKLFPDPLGVVQFSTYVLIGPINIKQNGFIRVRLIHRDQEIKVGALEVTHVERPESNPASP